MASKAVQVPQSLAALGFNVPSRTKVKRVNAIIGGLQKSGKTEFGCTAPGPIAFLGGDEGTRGVVEKHVARGKVIYLKEYPSLSRFQNGLRERKLSQKEHKQYAEVWEQQQDDYNSALECPIDQVRTVVVDGVSEWYTNARLANWSADSVGKFQFGPLNQMLSNMMRAALSTDKHVIFLSRLKKEYSGGDEGRWTGGYQLATFSDARFCAENCVMLSRDDEGDFVLEVEESRINHKLYRGREDSRLVGAKNVNFTNLAMMLFPGTDEEDWEDA